MVLCDADLMHTAGEDCFELMEMLRLEWQNHHATAKGEKPDQDPAESLFAEIIIG